MAEKRTRRRGFLASREGLALLEVKRREKGYIGETIAETYELLAEAAGLNADDQVKRLFNPHWGVGIGKNPIEKIAKVLDLNPKDFIDDWLPTKNLRQPQSKIDLHSLNWWEICSSMWQYQQKQQQIRRKATEMGFEVKVYVPLGLVERKQQQRRSGIIETEQIHQLEQEAITQSGIIETEQIHQLEQEAITQIYKHQEFLDDIIGQKPKDQDQHIAIIGEPGAGKTTLLDRIATYIKDNTQNLLICIPLANLQGRPLKTYILKEWLPKAIALSYPELDPESLEKTFQHRLNQGEVWLLLDGADEGKLSLAEIQTELSNFVKIRVVLTCRTNVWDIYVNNQLIEFKTYKTQDFKLEQIDQFIQGWFEQAKDEIRGKELQAKLKEPQRDRIRQLVTNPLRLALLCQIFYKDKNAELPETKAGLYEQFVRYFYEWKPAITGIDWGTQSQLQDELHQGLGKLAIAGLDSNYRYRLPLSLIKTEMDDKLFKLAWDLGWLTLVEREEKTDEEVYAFYHPTFQEYFAALVIDDWRKEFLNHVPHNPKLGIYRIFQPQWKQVILFWLGRKNVDDNEKEKFIESLVYFEDGCNGFYWYKTYFLAANGMAEFHNFSKGKEIVTQVVNWAFMNNNTQILESIKGESRKILLETNNNLAIFRLLEISEQTSSYLLSRRFFSTFQKICFGNQPYIIDELTKLLRKNKQYKYKCCELLKLIALMGNGNNAAIKEISNFIDELKKLIEDEKNHLIEEDGVQYCKYQNTLIEAARTLGIIDFNNFKAIRILIELSKRCNNEALKAISEIHCESDDNIVNVLIDIINQNDDCNSKINSLQALAKLQPNHSILVPELLNIITPTLEEIALRDRSAKILQQSEYNFEENEYLELEFVYLELPIMQGFEKNRKIALDALEEICKNNPHQQTNIIYELFELIYQCSDRTVIQEIIKSLARMGNHPIIIARFEKMLESKSKFNDYTLLTVAEGLKQIDRENQKDSQTLVEMLDSKDKTLCILASNILGKLEIKEDDAIRALENKIESTDNSNIQVKVKLIYNLSLLIPNHDLVNSTIGNIHFNDLTEEEILTLAYHLSKIKEAKNILFNKLLELTFAKDSSKKLTIICLYLQRMITRENAKKIIHSYRNYLSNQVMIKDYKNSHEIDNLLWHCAQHMSYPEFYQAWHESDTTKEQLETSYNDLTEILKQLQPTDQVYPILIDGKYSLENLTDESAIAQELCNKIYEAIFPDDDIPPVKNAPELKRLFPKFKRQLNILTLVFIIYNIEPYPELINVCRQLLGKFHIAFITDQQIEPDLRGFPIQSHLVNILQNWLTEISYKETL